jgi:hypothetical protein
MTETQPTTQALSAIRDSLNGTTPLGSMSWWIQGEVLASVANYWMLNAADPNVTAICQSIVEQATTNYRAKINPIDAAGIWFDDYGWWGIAFARLALYGAGALKGKVNVANLTELARECANLNARGANTWRLASAEQRKEWSTRAPLINIPTPAEEFPGLWNANFTMLEEVIRKGWNATLAAIQNTVTNGNYLLLCMYMARLEPANAYDWQRRAGLGMQWFKQWIDRYNPNNPDPSYQRYLGDVLAQGDGLIRERVPAMPNFSPNGFWSGDQGIWLGVMAELWSWPGSPFGRTLLVAYMRDLVLNLPMEPNGYQPINWENFPGGDSDTPDYNTGREVLIRHMLETLRLMQQLAPSEPDASVMAATLLASPPLAQVQQWAANFPWSPTSSTEFSQAGAYLAVHAAAQALGA